MSRRTASEPEFAVRGRDVIAVVSEISGASMVDLTEIARRLREAELFVRETRSERSWRCRPEHAANLLAAVMSGAPAIHTPEAVLQLADHRLTEAAWNMLPQPTPEWLSWVRQPPYDFLTGLDRVLDAIARFGPGFFESLRWVQVDLDLTLREASIALEPVGGKMVMLDYHHPTAADLSSLGMLRTVKLRHEALLRVGMVFHQARRGQGA